MYNLKIYPYRMGSDSAKELANLLNVMRVRPDGDYVPKISHKIINWGNGKNPNWAERARMKNVTLLNKPSAVGIAANKLTALQSLKVAGIRIPEFTTDMDLAQRWVNNGDVVVERHVLNGNSGDGIRIVTVNDDEMEPYITPAPLYTKFIHKTTEFRVHVFRNEVIDYIEKKRMHPDQRPDNFNKYVSSITCGWVFSRTNVRDITEVRQLAIRAVSALGLDFGAVDIVYADGLPYVLEVNTAPGLSGVTLVKYTNAFRRFMGQPDLPIDQTSSTTIRPQIPTVDEFVTLRIDRGTALKLRSLLSDI